jgi:hypothetical protein
MHIKEKTIRKLASLSALGAGTLALGAPDAEAGVISGSPNLLLGPWNGSGYTLDLPWNTQLRIMGSSAGSVYSGRWALDIFAGPYGQINFKMLGGIVNVFDSGKNWSAASGNGGMTAIIGSRSQTRTFQINPPTYVNTSGGGGYWQGGSTQSFLHGRVLAGHAFTNQYVLFQFCDETQTNYGYGWLQLSQALDADTGPNVTVERWAYDDTGYMLPAGSLTGDTGSIPEPSSLVLSGLGALALGAAGLRRWRAARRT